MAKKPQTWYESFEISVSEAYERDKNIRLSIDDVLRAAVLEQLKRVADALEKERNLDNALPFECEHCGGVHLHEPVVQYGRVIHFVCQNCTYRKLV